MKSSLTLLVFVLVWLVILAGCAPGPNLFKGTASEHYVVAGFWLGLWHGFIAPFVFMASELGITSATCSAWPASSVAAATVRRVGSKSRQQVPSAVTGQIK